MDFDFWFCPRKDLKDSTYVQSNVACHFTFLNFLGQHRLIKSVECIQRVLNAISAFYSQKAAFFLYYIRFLFGCDPQILQIISLFFFFLHYLFHALNIGYATILF